MRPCLKLFLLLFFCIYGCTTPKIQKEKIAAPTSAKIIIPGSGITIRSFSVVPNSSDFESTLLSFGEALEDSQLDERLASEGMTVRIVDSIDVPAIAASLGESQEERFDWHGQIMNWRDVIQRKMPASGMLVTAGGISHLVDHGYLTLLARGWEMGMEDGDQLYLQLLPVWHVPAQSGVIPGKKNAPSESRIFSELMVECLLDDDQSLLVVTQLEPEKVMTGPFDDGPSAIRLGEALMGGPVEDPIQTFLLFEAHVGFEGDK
jgi:hypothetical protein